MDKNKIKELITEDNKQLGTSLGTMNTELSGSNEKTQRRQINKLFVECLMEVKLSLPQALIWMKRHVKFETCDIIMSDWNYSGTQIQIIRDKIGD